MDPREAVKKRASEVGFDLVGIAPVPPGRDLEFAREWAARGYGGQMKYLASPKRFDPRSVLPSVRSVICVGLIYDTAFPSSVEVGSRQKAEGNRQNSESRIRIPEGPTTPDPLPSPSGKGWPREAGSSEGAQNRVSNFEVPVSNFQFPVSLATGPRAWISRYAWGRDYHEIVREKLERLRTAIEELAPGIETRLYVDTGPVIERAFARFSGLGWMGKNTCIINEEKGSWFFLGVILTNLELEPDLPAPDRCGSCRACLDACPTGALVEPYVMDASRCISYLTIELQGSIPLELRPGVGVNIFGCDICQDVCPWNRKGRFQVSGARSQESGFEPMTVGASKLDNRTSTIGDGQTPGTEGEQSSQPSAVSSRLSVNLQSSIDNRQSQLPGTRQPAPETFSLFNPPLEALLAMTEDEFRKAFAHSPIKRAKYRGWLRNLCVAMGNSGDGRFIPRLKELAAHPAPIIREKAEWALNRITRRD
jgi:epoxyqueuosine reductase QueG